MTKHTSLPWLIFESYDEIKGPGIDSSKAGISIILFGTKHEPDMGIQGRSPKEAKANAKFIVKACNSHYKLLEALKDTLKLLEEIVQAFEVNAWNTRDAAILDKVYATIKKATEE